MTVQVSIFCDGVIFGEIEIEEIEEVVAPAVILLG